MKRIASLLLTGALVLSLTACGKEEASEDVFIPDEEQGRGQRCQPIKWCRWHCIEQRRNSQERCQQPRSNRSQQRGVGRDPLFW